ncbi:hypothetical protein [Streptomyces sp. ME19-01-6]|uniref:hypothetical protein n=1 Tax=Streptomyces sp. ME19-01-6 TaxID=3028686 RepID=UPI0029B70A89|nr:hypothetical protein [Streptomyces sp. ME19-01-6]MDX3233453.1 hypothetical protein [Streptomyces sp. ME19-01-6]
MGTFYHELRLADFGPLDTLATKWKDVHDKIKDLDDKIRDKVLKPLKDKGYWEGMAAPYAWTQIDDIQRQVTTAAKVVDGVRRAIEDGAGELKAAQKKLNDAVKEFGEQGMYVDPKVRLVLAEACTPANYDEDAEKKVNAAQTRLNTILREAFEADQNLSITLMENVGLELWFNSGKIRTDINHTSGISTDRNDMLGRDMRGLDPSPSTNHLTPRASWPTGWPGRATTTICSPDTTRSWNKSARAKA